MSELLNFPSVAYVNSHYLIIRRSMIYGSSSVGIEPRTLDPRMFHFRRILEFQGANLVRGSRCAENETYFVIVIKKKNLGVAHLKNYGKT